MAHRRSGPRLTGLVVACNVNPRFAKKSSGDGTDIREFEFIPLSGPDTDGDGISDDFEALYGVTDPNADANDDGLMNLDELKPEQIREIRPADCISSNSEGYPDPCKLNVGLGPTR